MCGCAGVCAGRNRLGRRRGRRGRVGRGRRRWRSRRGRIWYRRDQPLQHERGGRGRLRRRRLRGGSRDGAGVRRFRRSGRCALFIIMIAGRFGRRCAFGRGLRRQVLREAGLAFVSAGVLGARVRARRARRDNIQNGVRRKVHACPPAARCGVGCPEQTPGHAVHQIKHSKNNDIILSDDAPRGLPRQNFAVAAGSFCRPLTLAPKLRRVRRRGASSARPAARRPKEKRDFS